jgi:hypothetical protein
MNILHTPYITKVGLQNLDKHKYSCGVPSFLEQKLGPFWDWLVKFIPLVFFK